MSGNSIGNSLSNIDSIGSCKWLVFWETQLFFELLQGILISVSLILLP